MSWLGPLTDTVATPYQDAWLERAVMDTLTYADVFDYPLTLAEIHRYLTCQRATIQEVRQSLKAMLESAAAEQVGEYYVLPGRQAIVETRRLRAKHAASLWRKAERYGRLIAALPYVRMLAVTGSLAVDNTEPDGDIDVLLVTAPGRLWTCRALVVLLTRLAKLDGTHLCPNYLVTTNALNFDEPSLYVAHEVAQMIPLSGTPIYDRIRSANAWTNAYLPNAGDAPQLRSKVANHSGWQRFLESVLERLPVAWFETWERQRKIGRLAREQAFNPEAYFSTDVCKGHVDKHRQQTEARLSERLQRLESL